MKIKILLSMILCCFGVNLFAQTSFVYVNDDVSPNTVSGFSVNSDGSLTLVPGSPFLTGGNGGGDDQIDPGKITTAVAGGTGFLYAANTTDGTLTGFRINPQTGALVVAPGNPFPIGSPNSNPTLASSPNGEFLFATDDINPVVHVFRISGVTGALTEVPGSPFNVGAEPEGLKVSPNGRFLAVGLQSIDAVGIFSIGPQGALTEAPGSPAPTSALTVGVDINCHNNRVFVASAGSTLINAFQLAENGSLASVPGSPFASGGNSTLVALALNPDNRLLFTGNTFDSAVSSLGVDGNGALQPAPGSPFSADNFVGRVETTRAGNFVYASLFAADSVDGWSVSADGALTPVPGNPFFAGQSQIGQSSVVVFPAASCSGE